MVLSGSNNRVDADGIWFYHLIRVSRWFLSNTGEPTYRVSVPGHIFGVFGLRVILFFKVP
jgi:hypothetical protein